MVGIAVDQPRELNSVGGPLFHFNLTLKFSTSQNYVVLGSGRSSPAGSAGPNSYR